MEFLEKVIKEGIESFLNDIKTNRAAKYSLIIIVEAMMNVLQHILAKGEGVAVKGYGDTFVKGAKYKIISEKLATKLQSLAGLRNEFLTHGYWRCNDELLFNLIMENLSDIKEFIKEIKEYIGDQ